MAGSGLENRPNLTAEGSIPLPSATIGRLGEWLNQQLAKLPRPPGSCVFESRSVRHKLSDVPIGGL